MTHERVLLVVEPSTALGPVLQAATRFAPDVTQVFVAATGALSRAELDALAAHYEGAPLELSVEQHVDVAQLPALVRQREASLVVAGPWPSLGARARVLTLLEVASPHGADVLSVDAHVPPSPPRTGVAAVTMHVKSTAMAATMQTARALPGVTRFEVLLRGATRAQVTKLEPQLAALLPTHQLSVRALQAGLAAAGDALRASDEHATAEVLVVATDDLWSATRTAAALLSAEALEHAERPVLILHHAPDPSLLPHRLTATGLPFPPGPRFAEHFPVVVEQTSVRGRATLAPDETFLLVGAEERGPLSHQHGVVELPLAWVPPGARRVALRSSRAPSPVAQVRLFKPDTLLLADARATEADVQELERYASTHTIVFVRLRARETLEELRVRLSAWAPWHVRILDASALLDDGGAVDVPESVDGLRLQRVAARLDAKVFRATVPASNTLRAGGHRVALQLDNHVERERLLRAIASARERVHWQCYIVDDDAVAVTFIDALREAGARGVTVRVLVDALYSRHDVYGAKNPVLERLRGAPNVTLRVSRPLDGVPSLTDLKQRNHRKLVVVDGRAATVSGRNLGATYYRGFEELTLTAETPYREVPWFDASATLEGPLVERLERTFLDDWTRAGGDTFIVAPVPKAGDLDCELVLHEGLEDTRTLDAQLALVHSAQRSLLFINTFPLVLELQHALLRALGRGVEVRFLFGNVRPRWGAGNQLFPGGAMRALGDNLVRARLEPLLRAGARGYELGTPSPTLTTLWPHVHAKLYVRDEDTVAVGSANVDVTSAYWESEALLLIHDAEFARQTLASLNALLARSRLVDPLAPSWAHDADRREWLARNWPSIVG